MTESERERIAEAGKTAAVGAPPIPEEAAQIIREAFRARPLRAGRVTEWQQ